jgi:hypothetical protein
MIRRSIDRIKRYLLYLQRTKMIVIDLDARKNKRRPVLDKGLIRFGDMSMSCVIHNLSKSGVALDVGSQVGIPDQFTLIDMRQRKSIPATSSGARGDASGSRSTERTRRRDRL